MAHPDLTSADLLHTVTQPAATTAEARKPNVVQRTLARDHGQRPTAATGRRAIHCPGPSSSSQLAIPSGTRPQQPWRTVERAGGENALLDGSMLDKRR
jgi:hypothetical protein